MSEKPDHKIGHGYTFVEELPMELLYTVYSEHHRLETFAHNGLECVCCGLVGARLVKAKDNGGGIHVDVYTENWILMTVDHEIPRAKGGQDILTNKQPMCTNCNHLKGCKMITNQELRELKFRDLFKIFYKYVLIIILAHDSPCTNPKVLIWTSGGSSHRKGAPIPDYTKRRKFKRNVVVTTRRLQVV